MKFYFLGAFVLVAIMQWFIPLQMISSRETILEEGKAFKFLTAPVDPADPFRGRYVALNFAISEYNVKETGELKRGPVYASLTTDDSGYAKIKSLSTKPPSGTTDYFSADINYIRTDSINTVFLTLPFDQYFMDEVKATAAENVYRESSQVLNNRTYALVKILNGEAVIQDVLINDTSIHYFVKKAILNPKN
ncbi:MAG: GDYXXLXY domain-containing protein [Chitinophagaceae bacterium]|nr:GDYXXLXY domain-containing protein [Chitinophagaceae bacterium]